MGYTKEINRTFTVYDNGKDSITLIQKNPEEQYKDRPDDIIYLDEAEQIELYHFLHNKFGGQ
ncbi:hypothetical protein KZJ38_07445 [Paraburkholderia edwinii]|uniref:Uncharacterized protein n=1 Tax=Paraburkholderia edwinii TaxID=2861782 RepID=A0ABX8UTC3_9BURK|nr:hypothetical protein [Paraburkholderia edwinii]QYD70133.1 hypothetical protein KZJ38_07445 [Paraburkholderia edwinii]